MHAALSPRGTTLIVSLILTAVFFTLSGCSTLGIATTKEMESVQSWQDSTGRVVADMDQRLAYIDSVAAELERLEMESTTALDSLEARLDRAKAWAERVDLDGIAERAGSAENAAWQAAARTDAVSDMYLQRLLVQRDELLTHIDHVMAVNDSLKTLESPQDSTMFTDPGIIIRSAPQDAQEGDN
jgi:hypothetical protein